MEFESVDMNEMMSDADLDISGVDSDDPTSGIGSDDTDADTAGNGLSELLDGQDADGDGLIFGRPLEEVITGTNDDDVLSGTTDDDILFSGSGDDELIGGDGNDTLNPGFGSDTINGGAGIDTISFATTANVNAVRVNLSTGIATIEGQSNLESVITNVENVIGSPGADVIIGNDLDNDIEGFFSFDTIDGGEGNDTARFDNIDVETNGNLATGLVTFPTFDGSLAESLINIENLVTGISNDTLVGNNDNNGLFANIGDDILDGGVGNDTLDGFEGNDTYVFRPGDSGADVITAFEDGESIDVSAFGFDDNSLGSVIEGAQQVGGDALLTFEEDNTVLLVGTQVDQIDTSDFII